MCFLVILAVSHPCSKIESVLARMSCDDDDNGDGNGGDDDDMITM